MSNAHILLSTASLSLPAHGPSLAWHRLRLLFLSFPRSPFIYIDAHILATPAIADLDGDGAEELVVAVSYFYDRQYYEKEVGHFFALQRNHLHVHVIHSPLPALVGHSRSHWHATCRGGANPQPAGQRLAQQCRIVAHRHSNC